MCACLREGHMMKMVVLALLGVSLHQLWRGETMPTCDQDSSNKAEDGTATLAGTGWGEEGGVIWAVGHFPLPRQSRFFLSESQHALQDVRKKTMVGEDVRP